MKLHPMSPAAAHPTLTNLDGTPVYLDGDRCDRYDRAKAKPYNQGMTLAERVAAGYGSPEDIEEINVQNRKHQEWLASPAGRKWEGKPEAPTMRVRLLGWQPAPRGGGVWLYNEVSSGSTVTLASLEKQGFAVVVE